MLKQMQEIVGMAVACCCKLLPVSLIHVRSFLQWETLSIRHKLGDTYRMIITTSTHETQRTCTVVIKTRHSPAKMPAYHLPNVKENMCIAGQYLHHLSSHASAFGNQLSPQRQQSNNPSIQYLSSQLWKRSSLRTISTCCCPAMITVGMISLNTCGLQINIGAVPRSRSSSPRCGLDDRVDAGRTDQC